MIGRSHIVLVKGWSGRRRGLVCGSSLIGGLGGCMFVVVVWGGSIVPSRPDIGVVRMQCWLVQDFCGGRPVRRKR